MNGIGGKVTEGKDGVARTAAGSGKESITKAVSAINPKVKDNNPAKQSKAWRAVRGIKEPVTPGWGGWRGRRLNSALNPSGGGDGARTLARRPGSFAFGCCRPAG